MADQEVLRLGIDPRPAAQGAREYRRATEDVSKAATQAATANDQLNASTRRMSEASVQAADGERKRTAMLAAAAARRAEFARTNTVQMLSLAQAEAQAAAATRTTTVATQAATVATQRATVSAAMFRPALSSLAAEQLAVNRGMLGLVSRLGMLAASGPAVVGALLGATALAAAHRALTKDTREAAEAQDRLTQSLLDAQAARAAESIPGMQAAVAETERMLAEALQARSDAQTRDISFRSPPEWATLGIDTYADKAEQAEQAVAKLSSRLQEQTRILREAQVEHVTLEGVATRTQKEIQEATEQATEAAKRAADEAARALKQRIDARQGELDFVTEQMERARQYTDAAKAATEAAQLERYEAEAMLAAKKMGKSAEEQLTVALAAQAAVRANLGKVSEEQLNQIARDAAAKARAIIDTQNLIAAEEQLTRAIRDQAEERERRRDYLIGAATTVATSVAGGGVIGGVIGGAISGGLAGSAVPGIGTAVGAVIGATTALVTGLIGQSQRAREEAKRAEEAKRQLSLSRADFYDELAAREMEIAGQTEQAEAFRLEIEQRRQLIEIQKLDLGWKEEEVLARVNAVHAAERAAAAAERAAEAEKKLAEEREKAVRAAEDMYTRGLVASGQDVAAARAAVQFSQRRELADAPEDQREALTVLHEIERNQLEISIYADQINQAAQEQIDRLDRQVAVQEKALRVAEEQLRTHERSLEEARRVVEAISQFRNSLKLGPLSTLSPIDREKEAERQFEKLRAAAMKGDAEAGAALPAAAQALLEASREVNASGLNYVADFKTVQAALDKVQADFADQATIEEQIFKELQKQTAKQERQIEAAAAQEAAIREKANDQINAFRNELSNQQAYLAAVLYDLTHPSTGGHVYDGPVVNNVAEAFVDVAEPQLTELQAINTQSRLSVTLLQAGFLDLSRRLERIEGAINEGTEEARRTGELIGVRL